jgi:hypothetical protein
MYILYSHAGRPWIFVWIFSFIERMTAFLQALKLRFYWDCPQSSSFTQMFSHHNLPALAFINLMTGKIMFKNYCWIQFYYEIIFQLQSEEKKKQRYKYATWMKKKEI